MALRTAGAAVTDTSGIGEGFPDLVVSYRNRWFLIEVKDGSKPPSARKLRGGQKTWAAKQHADVHVVKSLEEALSVLGVVKGSTWREAMGDNLRG